MATTRLRKTFKYPTDSSDEDNLPNDMDEEGRLVPGRNCNFAMELTDMAVEQEKLIQRLQAEDDERNEEYKRFFFAIPSISATSYLPTLIRPSLLSAKLISLLSMTSLIATAYILIFIPNTRPDKSRRQLSGHKIELKAGPIQQHLGYLNGGLSLLIALNALAFKDKGGVHDGFWLLCLLPLGKFFVSFPSGCQADVPTVSFSVIVLARRLMLAVDIGELEKLKYQYKGA
ncbi:hypothetical protein ACLMJK_007343 [Lecanora helva]